MYENYGWKYVLTGFIVLLWAFGFKYNDIPLGLDLKGGSEIIYTLDFQGRAPSVEQTEDAIRVLRERVDELGIKELTIRRQGQYDVVVQVPDATPTEVERIKSQIERAGRLQFKLVASSLSGLDKQAEIDRIIEQKQLGTWQENDRYDVAYYHEQARGAQPGTAELLENCTPSGKPLYVDGSLLEDAYRAPDERGRAAVGFTFDAEGSKRFGELTGANIGRSLAIILDGEIRSAPRINSEIRKKGIIEGGDQGWDEKELTNLIVTLKAGALPAKPVFAYRKDVGAQLGQAAVRIGGIATLASLLGIMAFMCWYYGLRAGMVANIGLALNLYLLLGTLAMFGATLTLPGIAGIVLGAAMGLDTNILIYERIREEHARGAALKQAIQAGYDRAFWTIVDTHLTTVLTALVLVWAGTGPIKGFGLTLAMSLVASMFTALFVTQALYGLFVTKGFITAINFRILFEKINFDYWAMFPKAAVLSLTLIGVGWVVFLLRGDAKYGIDFTGGTSLQIVLKEPIEKTEVEGLVEEHFKKLGKQIQVEIQRVGPRVEGGTELSREWQLRTRLIDASETKVAALPNPIDALISPAYGQDTAPAETRTPADVAPVESADPAAGGDGERGGGGSAPASTSADETARASQEFFANEIRKLFAGKLVEPYPALEGKEYVTVPADDSKVRARFQADLISLPKGGFDTAIAPLTEDLIRTELPKALRALAARETGPEMLRRDLLRALAGEEGKPGFDVKLVKQKSDAEATYEFVTSPVPPAQVSRVVEALKNGLERARDHQVFFTPAVPIPNIDQIGSVVAKNLKSKAIVATIFSVLLICLYVWLRYDLWAGITAIVAVGHDVLALLGFLSILDLLLSVAGVNFDVKFSLTTITAFLTLVGFSINDTIVILDRIREEMHLAKAKDYSPEIVNLAINKTLSRTFLTSATVFLCVFVLFVASFYGLTAIQGFSVALLFGVAAGTYSTVFVAAPLLLCDRRKTYLWLGGVVVFMIVTLVLNMFRT